MTVTAWAPSGRDDGVKGDVHAEAVPPSTLHANVVPLLVNEKEAFAVFDKALGVLVQTRVLVVAPRVHVKGVEVAVFPARSVARTEKVCAPLASPV